jgi:hypothetical protein
MVVLAIEVWRTRTPFLVRHPWILDWLESIKTRTGSDTTGRADTANQRGGSEWEPTKNLLEGDGDSNKTNTASNTRLRLTTQVGQVYTATEVLLDLVTNKQPSEPKHTNMHSVLESLSDFSRPWNKSTPKTPPARKENPTPNLTNQLQTNQEQTSNTKTQRHTSQAVHPRQIPRVTRTGQTGQEHRSDWCSLGSSG